MEGSSDKEMKGPSHLLCTLPGSDPQAGIEPGPHWCEAHALPSGQLNSAPTLELCVWSCKCKAVATPIIWSLKIIDDIMLQCSCPGVHFWLEPSLFGEDITVSHWPNLLISTAPNLVYLTPLKTALDTIQILFFRSILWLSSVSLVDVSNAQCCFAGWPSEEWGSHLTDWRG